MATHSWRCTALAVLAIGAAACGGGGGGGGGPTEPSPPIAIQGTWGGTATSQTGTGTCLAETFQGLTVPARWAITQTGAAFTGQQTLNNVITCPFRGTVSGSTVTFFPDTTGPAFCTVQNATCGTGANRRTVRMELRLDRAIQTGTVVGNRMSTTSTAVFRVFDSRTGQSLGEYEVRGVQELERR